MLVGAVAASSPASATWVDRADLIYGTAHVLDEGEFEFGIFSPLQVGLHDQVQLAFHPILLLVLAPHAALRWRITPEGPVTVSMDFSATWSFLDRVDDKARRIKNAAACDRCGSPGTLQLTGTVSGEVADGLTWSGGGGLALDFLDIFPEKAMIELHTSLMWLIDPENLLMLHASMNIHPWYGSDVVTRPSAQLMYAHAWGFVHLGVGVAFGRFPFFNDGASVRTLPGQNDAVVTYEGDVTVLPVYPVVDLWFRL